MAEELINQPNIDKADVLGNLPFHVQDINNPTVASPNGESKQIDLDQIVDYVKSKAIVVPAGSVIGDALLLTKFDNVADVVGAGTGVKLASNAVDYEVEINNNGANDLKVYPLETGNIDGAGVNVAVVITPGNIWKFKIYATGLIRVFVL